MARNAERVWMPSSEGIYQIIDVLRTREELRPQVKPRVEIILCVPEFVRRHTDLKDLEDVKFRNEDLLCKIFSLFF